MTTDNLANEPTPEQVEAAAKAMHETRNPWIGAYGDWGATGYEIKQAFRESARAALEAAQGAAPPVNSFDTTVERVKNGADSLHVAPQVPNQNETKSGNNFVSLDPEKVTAQGAAPQAESEDNVMCRCGHGTGSHDFSDPQEPCREIVCDCRGWFGVSPVLPSSTESPVEPFKTWFACWWKNEPNAIAESNAQSAFYAGWDARGLSG